MIEVKTKPYSSPRGEVPGVSARADGFTLVELVAVIVLLSIIAVASTQFIRQGVGIYTDSAGRDRLQQQARFAIERMSRELRNALPGSVRVRTVGATQCIEFMPVQAASSYLETATDGPRTSLPVVEFGYSFTAGDPDLIAIYPISSDNVYATPAALSAVTGVTAPSSNQQTLSFSSIDFPNESPTRRFYIVTEPVSFCAADNSLTRHQGYTRTDPQPVPPGSEVLLAENIRVVNQNALPIDVFTYTAGTPRRAAVVNMNLFFSDVMTLGDEWLTFSQEVFVRNTP